VESSAEELGRGLAQYICGGAFWGLLIAIGVMLIVRELWCWYWKLNHIRKSQDEQTALLNEVVTELRELRRTGAMPPPVSAPVATKTPPPIASNAESAPTGRRCPNGHLVRDDRMRYCPMCGVPMV
jgi:hypothetical protein